MAKEYVVTFINLDANKVGCDCFIARTTGEATNNFFDCYRHAKYKILSVVKTGRECEF